MRVSGDAVSRGHRHMQHTSRISSVDSASDARSSSVGTGSDGSVYARTHRPRRPPVPTNRQRDGSYPPKRIAFCARNVSGARQQPPQGARTELQASLQARDPLGQARHLPLQRLRALLEQLTVRHFDLNQSEHQQKKGEHAVHEQRPRAPHYDRFREGADTVGLAYATRFGTQRDIMA